MRRAFNGEIGESETRGARAPSPGRSEGRIRPRPIPTPIGGCAVRNARENSNCSRNQIARCSPIPPREYKSGWIPATFPRAAIVKTFVRRAAGRHWSRAGRDVINTLTGSWIAAKMRGYETLWRRWERASTTSHALEQRAKPSAHSKSMFRHRGELRYLTKHLRDKEGNSWLMF